MLSFESDYTTGAHEQILRRLRETNLDPQPGYGSDSYCESARQKIRQACACPEADIFFLTGGTQTNALVISSLLQQHEGVLPPCHPYCDPVAGADHIVVLHTAAGKRENLFHGPFPFPRVCYQKTPAFCK